MTISIPIHIVADALEILSSEHLAFLNPETGDLVELSFDEIQAVEEETSIDRFPEWQQPLIEQARVILSSDTYLQLPTTRDIHEYAIMERFCESVEHRRSRDRLLAQIRGSGAFQRFKQTIAQLGLRDEWFRYRRNALESIAIDWLEEKNIPYHQHDVKGDHKVT